MLGMGNNLKTLESGVEVAVVPDIMTAPHKRSECHVCICCMFQTHMVIDQKTGCEWALLAGHEPEPQTVITNVLGKSPHTLTQAATATVSTSCATLRQRFTLYRGQSALHQCPNAEQVAERRGDPRAGGCGCNIRH